MRKIYVDFDNTLYDTSKFKEAIICTLSQIISKEIKCEYSVIYNDVKSMFCKEKIYNIFELCNYYENKFKLKKHYLHNYMKTVCLNGKQFLYNDSVSFLKALNKLGYEVNILTYTEINDREQQIKKIKGTHIANFCKDIIICSKEKGELNLDYHSDSIFVDDNPSSLISLFNAGVKPENIFRLKRIGAKYSLNEITEFKPMEFQTLNEIDKFLKENFENEYDIKNNVI